MQFFVYVYAYVVKLLDRDLKQSNVMYKSLAFLLTFTGGALIIMFLAYVYPLHYAHKSDVAATLLSACVAQERK